MAGFAAVEAEHEFVELRDRLRWPEARVGLQVSTATQAVMDAERPAFEAGEDAVDSRRHHMGGERTDDTGIVGDIRRAGIAGPAIGLDGGAGCHIGGERDSDIQLNDFHAM